jgi:rhamnogalacturonyl hydrolase YesR
MKKLLAVLLCASAMSFAATGEDYISITGDGGWCWFSDPRAISEGDFIYSGWVSEDGSVIVGKYDRSTHLSETFNLHPKFQKDDHDNPALQILPDGRIAVYYTGHLSGPMIMRISRYPGDISLWDVEKILPLSTPKDNGITYANPVYLSGENKYYLFWRGIDYEPTMSVCKDLDNEVNWAKSRQLFKSREAGGEMTRPYTKVVSNGRDEIHFVFTDGHPRRWPANSLYYMMYKGGKFYNAEGEQIGSIDKLPITKDKADVVYKATGETGRGWDWDIALDSKDRPVIVYTRMPAEDDHRYHYTRWDGTKWIDNKVADAGKWFPQTPRGGNEPEPHYSAGIIIDHSNPDVLYLSKPVDGVFEIFRYETNDFGASWHQQQLTSGSHYDNVRPFVPRGSEGTVLWQQNRRYRHYTDYSASIKVNQLRSGRVVSAQMPQAEDVRGIMTRVADWQLDHYPRHRLGDWTWGAMFAGMLEWAQMSGSEKYYDYLRAEGEKTNWTPTPRPYHADDFTTSQMYLALYEKYGEPQMLEGTKKALDYILAHRSKAPLIPFNGKSQERWSWCDALFMAPPVWAQMAKITGEQKYLDFMNAEWKVTTKALFDEEENLYFRDASYFDKREKNGEKVFWSRGNGWVMGGIVRVLEQLPENSASRDFYVKLLQKMSAKVITLQQPDGLWHSSLLDPVTFAKPESSGSGFYIYALAWGVNNGYLDRQTYLPAVIKGWNSLCCNILADGMVGYVQPIGADPRNITEELTDIYGTGAFLLAGSEVYRLAIEPDIANALTAVVSNDSGAYAEYAVVSLPVNSLKGIELANAGVIEAGSFSASLTQLVDYDSDGKPDELLFQACVSAGTKKTYYIMPDAKINIPNRTTYCRYVPERKDDFVFENNLTAGRVYGPALAVEGSNSGFDAWYKRVPYPIADNWLGKYQHGVRYHDDHGEGHDMYNVGKSAGAGGISLWENGKRVHSSVYDKWKVIANGPLRSIFELTYNDSWKTAGKEINEVKRFTIDLDDYFLRLDCSFTGKDAEGAEFAIGITTHDGNASAKLGDGLLTVEEKDQYAHLFISTLLISPEQNRAIQIFDKTPDISHAFDIVRPADGKVSYCFGWGWDGGGIDKEKWEKVVSDKQALLKNPLKIEIK